MVFPLARHRHFKHNQSNREILTLPINLTNKYWFICYGFISQLIWKSSLNITTTICPKPSLYPPRFNSQTSPFSSIQNTSQIYLLFSLFPLPLLSEPTLSHPLHQLGCTVTSLSVDSILLLLLCVLHRASITVLQKYTSKKCHWLEMD